MVLNSVKSGDSGPGESLEVQVNGARLEASEARLRARAPSDEVSPSVSWED